MISPVRGLLDLRPPDMRSTPWMDSVLASVPADSDEPQVAAVVTAVAPLDDTSNTPDLRRNRLALLGRSSSCAGVDNVTSYVGGRRIRCIRRHQSELRGFPKRPRQPNRLPVILRSRIFAAPRVLRCRTVSASGQDAVSGTTVKFSTCVFLTGGYTFPLGSAAATPGGRESGKSRRATPIRQSAIP
jgi:hypothetical protein